MYRDRKCHLLHQSVKVNSHKFKTTYNAKHYFDIPKVTPSDAAVEAVYCDDLPAQLRKHNKVAITDKILRQIFVLS